MSGVHLLAGDVESRADKLATASGQLEAVLETVDLAGEPELAEAMVAAVKATDRALHWSSVR